MPKASTILSPLMTLLLCANVVFAAEVYKEVDEDGVPTFSDVKTDKAETIEVREPMTFSSEDSTPQRRSYEQYQKELKEMAEKEQNPQVIKYSKLEITDPPNDSAIRENSGALTLSVSITPQVQPGHTAELMMNGLAIRQLMGSGPVVLANVDRGTHSFRVRVLDRNGKEIDSGPTTAITMLRFSALQRAR